MDTVIGMPDRLKALSSAIGAETRLQLGSAVADARLARAARGDGPVVAGPWLSEVGFEVLYWIPLLRWAAERHGIAPERMVAVTRGGAGAWYSEICGRTVEAFDHVPIAAVRAEQRRRAEAGTQKQRDVAPFDAQLLDAAQAGAATVLHPRMMYELFRPLWLRRRPLTLLERRVAFRPLPAPPAAWPAKPYVAVKTYFSDCFPDTPQNAHLLSQLLARLCASHRVVLLTTGLALDDHVEALAEAHGAETTAGRVSASDNLAVQSSVIAGAEALFCTYGGFAHLGPFLGTPTFAVHANDTFVPAHLDAMHRATRALRAQGSGGSFTLVSAADALTLLHTFNEHRSEEAAA